MALHRFASTLVASVLILGASTASGQHQIVCSGEAAGGYAAFPDICRLSNGDLFCVFYSGYGHVSKPNAQLPKGGRIMAVCAPPIMGRVGASRWWSWTRRWTIVTHR